MESQQTRFADIYGELKTKGFKQKELAEALGIKQQAVSKYLLGINAISEPTAQLIEAKFGYSAEWLLHGTGPKIKDSKPEISEINRIRKIAELVDSLPGILDILKKLAKMPKNEYLNFLEIARKLLK